MRSCHLFSAEAATVSRLIRFSIVIAPSYIVPDPTFKAISPWCNCKRKRAIDLLCGCLLLIAASPVMLVAALLIRLTSPGPILFRHKRVGKNGSEISVLKFRTMVHERTVSGPEVTGSGDCRITAVGRALRNWKIDELPQVINVLRGDMSMVGPRPDSAKYFERVSPDYLSVLLVKPGITSPVTIAFRNEEQLLSAVPEHELEGFYCSRILPFKLQLELDYAKEARFVTDLTVLLRTAAILFRRQNAHISILKSRSSASA